MYDSEKEERDIIIKRELKFKQLQKKWELLAEKGSPENVTTLRDTFLSKNM